MFGVQVLMGAGAINDPSFSSVTLLLYGNGASGSKAIIDSSSIPKTITAFGDAQISSAQSKFGATSLALDGSGDYLTIPYTTANFRWWDTAFTVESWIYVNNFTSAESNQKPNLIGNMAPGNLTNYWSFGTDSLKRVHFYYYTGSINVFVTSASNLLSLSTWHHIAMTHLSGTIRLFLDGVLVQTATVATAVDGAAVQLALGVSNSVSFNGYISNLRITKGVARYTSAFTPPISPFPGF